MIYMVNLDRERTFRIIQIYMKIPQFLQGTSSNSLHSLGELAQIQWPLWIGYALRDAVPFSKAH